jgi:hypothetical protein
VKPSNHGYWGKKELKSGFPKFVCHVSDPPMCACAEQFQKDQTENKNLLEVGYCTTKYFSSSSAKRIIYENKTTKITQCNKITKI